ncbi:MAG: histidine kinase [Planctomycetaceae bacterium]
MSVAQKKTPEAGSVLRLQLGVCAVFALVLGIIVAGLWIQECRREWTLRTEQARHRLDVAFDLISRELDGVRADALFLADQAPVRQFVQSDETQRAGLETEYLNFIRRKGTYDQIRLLDLSGRERIRINYSRGRAISVLPSELQDKSDRYYFRHAASLRAGQVFVSEFDFNLEYGRIEKPLKPVIRFVTPVGDQAGIVGGFLVLNYLGSRLLSELDNSTLPGFALLLRPDGHYLRSADPDDAWGWLLGHDRTFARQFPHEWSRIHELEDCALTARGAFAARSIPQGNQPGDGVTSRDSIVVVSYLPRDQVFAASHRLLKRLLLLAGSVFVPLAIFARYWAHAMISRNLQNDQIAISEERLRELSSRLLRIQEDERRAISREIHDDLGQQATAINLDLKLASRNIHSETARPHLERAIRENEQLLQSLHSFATRVRPAVLDDLGLRDAMESHLWEFQERTGIEVDANLSFDSAEIPDEIADNAYRLLQESLNNVAKHADASTVRVRMSIEKHDASQQLCIAIRDDGRGHDTSGNNGQRLGLLGIQERVDLLAGELQLKSDRHADTSIEMSLPFRDGQSKQSRGKHDS